MTEGEPILLLSIDEQGRLLVRCQPQHFGNPYKTGVTLAMAGRIICEAIRDKCGGNPNLREQAEAEMTKGFTRDMELPGPPPEVQKEP